MNQYFKNIKIAVSTLLGGLRLTLRYLVEARVSRKPIGITDSTYFDTDTGIITLQYPRESLPVPDNGRYRLHNEIDDCIVCDKCAKICPVDCIEIDPIRAVETFGTTSDGTPKKIYAAKFDIDMSKCCFCGLCTTVCPTECLTMTRVYDFSEYDVSDHIYSFAEMSIVEIAEKRQAFAAFEEAKLKEKAATKPSVSTKPKPVLKPKTIESEGEAKPKPVFRPKVKPVVKSDEGDKPKPKPVIRPKNEKTDGESTEPATEKKVKPVMKPRVVVKPKIKPSTEGENIEESMPKPKFKPRPMIPKKKKDDGD